MTTAPTYTPLPMYDDHDKTSPQVSSYKTRKNKHFKRFVLLVFIMVSVMLGLRQLGTRPNMFRWVVGGGGKCHHTGPNFSGGLQSHYVLNSGDKIPSVALGVWKAAPGEVGQAVKTALDAGYKHIDGAWIYRNEAEVGKALKESGVPREDIWITSKLWNTFHAPEDVEPILDESLAKLGTDYLDLKLEEMVAKGKVRNIGVSKIQNLTANPLKIQPAVNQVEINYFLPQPELVQTIVLPKSVTPSRIVENIHLTKLPDELFEKLEKAATSHPPERGSNPSKSWGLDFDIFE
ncbi:Aldo/keto reductase [Dendrothele bispora CBS 962.96]|uniref:Aldo/keto reductase n=1 Tax=Dendrothele bispora (strain CBS 962.96) TaxID=1314807 RepID=A0A4S8KP19_DENBC|nr:Aldo/keto reductase [Dendrothele bispora CBS 962.96]